MMLMATTASAQENLQRGATARSHCFAGEEIVYYGEGTPDNQREKSVS